MIRFLSTIACVVTALGVAPADTQSLSPEDISRMLDEQAAAPNPYAALLNDPDPERSMGAMRIMMESGDPELVEIALEYGLLSADPAVQLAAVEGYLKTEPQFRIVFDGRQVKDKDFLGQLDRHGAVVDDKNVGVATWHSGSFDPIQDCYTWIGRDVCSFRVSREGVFMMGSSFNSRLTIGSDGDLTGMARMDYIDELVPVSVRFLD